MYNEFDNTHAEPAGDFEQKLYNLLFPDRPVDSTNIFFLELVREYKTELPHKWFVLTEKKPNIDTMQLIEVTVKRLK